MSKQMKVKTALNSYRKAIHLWTGRCTLVPVTSSHYVTCPDCNYCDNIRVSSPCSRCHGCLDCRDGYIQPKTVNLSFNEFLTRIDDAHFGLPF